MAKITAPVPGFSGEIGGVRFAGGSAETENVAVLAYCRLAGYDVEAPAEDPAAEDPAGEEPETPPAKRGRK